MLDEILVKKIVSRLVDFTSEKVLGFLTTNKEDWSAAIEGHLVEIVSWSSNMQFYGMGKAKAIDEHSIALNMLDIPRKFRSDNVSHKEYDETSLLNDPSHYLLLGDPGSGKTTTIKRISRKLLQIDGTSVFDIYQYPILIRFRNFSYQDTIYKKLANIFCLKLDKSDTNDRNNEKINGENIEVIIARILNNTNAILLLDGLDELLTFDLQNAIEKQIEELGRKLNKAKIIVTCRSGNYSNTIEGFNLLEILPLSQGQIESIISKWADDPIKFLKEFRTIPYRDLANRPLLLCQLLFIFNSQGRLPEKPSQLYKIATNLLLDRWDANRRIKRESNYSGFNSQEKHDFLAELAFHLLYKKQKKSFTEEEMESSYCSICDNHNLPLREAKMVAKEIESHSGIIIEASNGRYEFSHLTLQEYLCAYFLVRNPFDEDMRKYIYSYTPPLAVAVSMAGDSSKWLANLILKKELGSCFDRNKLELMSSRMIAERPIFKSDVLFGYALIKMISIYYMPELSFSSSSFEIFINQPKSRKAISRVITQYFVIKSQSSDSDYFYFLEHRGLNQKDDDLGLSNIEIPTKGIIQKQLVKEICIEHNISYKKSITNSGQDCFVLDFSEQHFSQRE